MLPRNVTIICVAVVIGTTCHWLHKRTKAAMLVGEALELIDNYYVDPVDDRALLISAMDGMTSTLDQHSEFIPPLDYESFQDSIQQEFAGIGIYVEQPTEGEPVRVITPLVGSPALAAGLLPGDQIVEIDGEQVGTLNLRDVSTRLRGPAGTIVNLVLQRGEEKVPAEVTRQQIQLESVIGDYRDESNAWVYRLRAKPEIAYIKMTSFGDKTVRELADVLGKLNNDFEGLVLDLRGNGGGLLTAAADVSDMFLTKGRIVSTKTRGGVLEDEFTATENVLVDPSKSVAILIDQDSASASEIVAAALQDYERAIVAGTRSFGKGTVQNILPLEYGRSALRLTVAKYYRPSDRNIHRGKDDTEEDEWGVTPNEGLMVELELPELRRLNQLWQEASYPSLKGVDRFAQRKAAESTEENEAANSEVGNSETENTVVERGVIKIQEAREAAAEQAAEREIDPEATSWDLDGPLRAAVERMLQQNEESSAAEAA